MSSGEEKKPENIDLRIEPRLETEKFNGKCYKCGKTGRKANDPVCPLYNNGAFKGKCNKCGVRGHKEKDCWENEANKDKRPMGWKSRLNSEVGNAAVDSEELLL